MEKPLKLELKQTNKQFGGVAPLTHLEMRGEALVCCVANVGSAQPVGNLTVTGPASVIIVEQQTENIRGECAAASGFALSSEDTQ